MEQKQITLEKMYEMLKRLELQVEILNENMGFGREFTDEENQEFTERTRKAWQEIDEGKSTTYNSPEEFFATLKGKDAQNN